jgi:hypothetical protein
MSRPVDQQARFRVKTHVTKGYTYASTQQPSINPDTGKKIYRYVHWGSVDENLKFIPGSRFFLASPEERSQLIFPDIWDISEALKSADPTKPEMPAYTGESQNRLYGDIWLLEQVAEVTGVKQDLEKVFHGNQEIVADILTLAIFPYITKYSFNRVARWQRNVKSPSSRELSPTVITRLTQSITEAHRMDLLKLRAEKLGKEELCAVDSTSRSAYGSCLADIRWGFSKDHLPLEQTTEVVVYTLTSHSPIYYRTFPGNMPDSRSLEVILNDLDRAGFKDLILVTDRGYETLGNLEKTILRGQSIIMFTKTSQKDISKTIQSLGEFDTRPEKMEIDVDTKMYYIQQEVDYIIKGDNNSINKPVKINLNIYFDPLRRVNEITELDIAIKVQKNLLDEMISMAITFTDISILNKVFPYYKVNYDINNRTIQSYQLNITKINKIKKLSGFFAIITHGVNFDAMKTYKTYRLRDEQEKYFQQMKSQMMAKKQSNWSEEGKTGRLFILFISLILSSHIRNIWKSTELNKIFSSSLEILDEMRSIRCIEHTTITEEITPFIGAQVSICEAFGFKMPEGCAPDYPSRKKIGRKRGRPRKK